MNGDSPDFVHVCELMAEELERLCVARADHRLEIRERIVVGIDLIDSGDPDSAAYYLSGLLKDMDAAVADDLRRAA